MQLDDLDRTATTAFEGYVVRKDLVRTFSRQFPVPTYVVEFLLGRYCATTDEAEIQEGLDIVQRQLGSRTVKAGEEELFKAHARESGSVKIIDIITARLDARTDSYVATLPSLRLTDVRLTPAMVTDNERMLTGGFYAEMTLSYDASIAQEKGGRPFGVDSLRAIQLSKREVLDVLAKGRQDFSTSQWRDLLLRSVGFEPDTLSDRAKDALLLRMVSFVERNYNLVELGPRGTGKSHLFQQVSPYAHLISGGKATVARMFVNNATGQRGLVCQYDVVCFDEVSGVSFDQKDGVNIMKGYMESGEFSRGKESIRADGSVVLVGNFEVDVEHQQRIGHLFGPLPPELQSQSGIGDEPLECGQIWTLSPGGQDEHPGLFRLEATEGPGSGVRVLNNPAPPAFKESIRCAEQNLYARAQQLVGDRDPRAHEFSVQLRGFDAARSGAKTAVAALIALSSALLKKSVRGGLVVVGEVTLGGTIEPIHSAVTLAELAVEKGAKSLLLPVACRRQLFDLSDEMATKLDIEFYQDGRDALLKALVD